MNAVAHSHESSQAMTPQDRVRRQVGLRLVPQIAELLYRADKGNEWATLADLRSDGARAVYLADALLLLHPEQRIERMKRVHAQDAHVSANAEDEGETAQAQARRDVLQFGAGISHFGNVAPGYCSRCTARIADPSRSGTLFVSGSLKSDVHVGCIADDIRRGTVERIAPFQFRVVPS